MIKYKKVKKNFQILTNIWFNLSICVSQRAYSIDAYVECFKFWREQRGYLHSWVENGTSIFKFSFMLGFFLFDCENNFSILQRIAKRNDHCAHLGEFFSYVPMLKRRHDYNSTFYLILNKYS